MAERSSMATPERTSSQRIAKQALSRHGRLLGPGSRPPFHTTTRRRKIRCTTRISVPMMTIRLLAEAIAGRNEGKSTSNTLERA
jgi:hypothetical protein